MIEQINKPALRNITIYRTTDRVIGFWFLTFMHTVVDIPPQQNLTETCHPHLFIFFNFTLKTSGLRSPMFTKAVPGETKAARLCLSCLSSKTGTTVYALNKPKQQKSMCLVFQGIKIVLLSVLQFGSQRCVTLLYTVITLGI